jgi:nucleoside-diphosphate-sugar epimerase
MKIFITGIAGAIGSHVAEAFRAADHDVSGIDNFDNYYAPTIKELNLRDVELSGARVLREDLVTGDLALLVPKETEFIFHFAAQPGISAGTPFDHYIRNNIFATEHLLDRAKTLPKLKAFVYISTSSVYGKSARGSEDELPRPTSGYGVTKLASEQLALAQYRSYGLPVIALRLFSVFGPRERPEKLYHKLTHAILTDQPFPLHEGAEAHLRSFTYVGDVVRAMEQVLERYSGAIGEIVNIGSDTTRTTEEGIRALEAIIGKRANLVLTPKRPGDQLETQAHIKKAQILLGFTPKISLEEGLEAQVRWHKEHLLPHLDRFFPMA